MKKNNNIISTKSFDCGWRVYNNMDSRRKMSFAGFSSKSRNLMYVGKNSAEGVICRF